MRILLITQAVDPEHDLLGFFPGWIRALRSRIDVQVVAQQTGRGIDQDHIDSLGKEIGRGKIAQLVRLQGILLNRSNHYDAVLCHMCPEYVLPSRPAAAVRGVPVLLWYTHGTASRALRLAHRLADRIFTASERDYPLVGDGKVVQLGHGIDLKMFTPSPLPNDSTAPRTILSIGRLSPVKGHEVLIHAAAVLNQRASAPPFQVRIVGGPPMGLHELYVEDLRQLVISQGLEGVVVMEGRAPYTEIPSHHAQSHLFVSASRTGSLDKAVLEAMACGRPVVTSSSSFQGELVGQEDRLMFRAGDPEDLADHLEDLLREDLASLQSLGTALAESVAERHELEAFADRLVGAIEDAVHARSAASATGPESR